jgi:hypothetical protein
MRKFHSAENNTVAYVTLVHHLVSLCYKFMAAAYHLLQPVIHLATTTTNQHKYI